MNERYLFRGKRIDNGEWISGYLWKNNKKSYISNDAVELMVVDSATVGQCTGLRDKTGTLIFEGDICKVEDYPALYVIEHQVACHFLYAKKYNEYERLGECYRASEVIGNIHDNPELIRRT